MPDLTAPQLIAILREHPVACGMLGIQGMQLASLWSFSSEIFDMTIWNNGHIDNAIRFRRWLVGAAVEKCDELDIEIVRYADGFGTIEQHVFKPTTFGGGTGIKMGKKHPTRLHAALAALEQHAKESK